MVFDKKRGTLFWKPSLSDEGENETVSLRVTDGSISQTRSFELHIGKPRLLKTSISNGVLTITDAQSPLKGLKVKPKDTSIVSKYRLYALSSTDTPAFTGEKSPVAKALFIKGNIGKAVQITLPLKGLVSKKELLTFHTQSYLGSGNWKKESIRILY